MAARVVGIRQEKKYQNPFGFCYYIKSSVGSKFDKLELYGGPDAADEFVKRIEDDCIKPTKTYVKNK